MLKQRYAALLCGKPQTISFNRFDSALRAHRQVPLHPSWKDCGLVHIRTSPENLNTDNMMHREPTCQQRHRTSNICHQSAFISRVVKLCCRALVGTPMPNHSATSTDVDHIACSLGPALRKAFCLDDGCECGAL